MTTIRSLLPDLLMARWTDLKPHSAKRARLIRSRFAALRSLSFFLGRLGRRRKPRRFALPIAFLARLSELPLQTSRTSPGPLPVTAEASERAFGTLPPAGGETEVSGAGSGQSEGRSRCAAAIAGTAIATAAMAAITIRM